MSTKSHLPLRSHAVALAAASALAVFTGAAASDAPRHEALNGSVHAVLGGAGANVSFSAGPDGLFFVDSGASRDAGAIIELAQGVRATEIRYLVNSDLHPAQTGGNQRFGKSGAVIVAHESVRETLAENLRGKKDEALPILTLPELGRVSFDFNDETIDVFHVAPAHSPGNVIVHFSESNVIHVGELFSSERYPTLAGGSIDAFVGALDAAVKVADFETIVVPSWGPVSDREGLIAYREMLISLRERVTAALDQGQTFDQFVAGNPTLDFDAQYGDPSDPLFLPVIFEEMSLRRQPAGQ